MHSYECCVTPNYFIAGQPFSLLPNPARRAGGCRGHVSDARQADVEAAALPGRRGNGDDAAMRVNQRVDDRQTPARYRR